MRREDREYIKKKAAVQDTLPVIKLKEDLNSKVHEIKIWEQRVNEREQVRGQGHCALGIHARVNCAPALYMHG